MRGIYNRLLVLGALCICCVGASSLAQTHATASTAKDAAYQAPSLEALAALPFIESPKLSPSGTKFAALLAINGTQILVIQEDTERPKLIGLGDNELNWVRWVNDDWLVAGIGQAMHVEGELWYVTRTARIAADGSKVEILLKKEALGQNASDVLWTAKDGSPRILLAYQKSIYMGESFWPTVVEVDVSTGRSKRVLRSRAGVMDYYADPDGVVRLAEYYDDGRRKGKLLARQNNGDTFHAVEEASYRDDESLTIPAIFMADPAKAIVYGDKEGFTAAYEYDLANMKLGKKLFSVDGYDIDAIIADKNGRNMAGVSYTDTARRTHWFDPELAQIQSDIQHAVGGNRSAQIVSMNNDHSALIIHVGSADHPGYYYYYALASGKMTLLGKISEKLGDKPLAPVRTVTYKARDGLSIQAILTLPKHLDAKNLPLILMPHGGPHARDYEGWDWIAQFLASRGYAVIQPNYRGSSGYGSAFVERSKGQWGLTMQDGLNDAVDWMVQQGMADAKRVCIMGGSYGGYAALRGAQRDGERYRCAISFAGVSDLTAILRYDRRFLQGNASSDYWKSEISDLKDVSPITFPEQFSTPVLLVHGKKDLRVPVQQSREMAEKLDKAEKIFRYIEQKEADHHFSREADRVEFLKEVDAFLRQYNPS